MYSVQLTSSDPVKWANRTPSWSQPRGNDEQEWIIVICGLSNYVLQSLENREVAYIFQHGKECSDKQIQIIPHFKYNEVATNTTTHYAEGGAVVSLGTTLFMIGGFYRCRSGIYEDVITKHVFRCDMILSSITQIAPMTESRGNHVAFLQDNSTVVAGGTDRQSMEYYDTKTNKWVPVISSVPVFVQSASISVNNRGFVCGGRRTSLLKQTYGCVKVCDDRYKWIDRAPLNKARANHTLVAVESKIFVHGGVSHANSRYMLRVFPGKVYIFGSFGLSTKEPYTIMLCPSSSLVSLTCIDIGIGIICAHLPQHRVIHRNFIFGTHMHTYPPYMHIKYLVILTCSF